MRVGIIRDTLFTNEPRGLNVAVALQKNGFDVFVLCYGKKNKIEDHNGITLVRFSLNKFLKNKLYPLVETVPVYKILWAKKIVSFAKTYNVDALHIHDLYMMGSALIANKQLNLPIVLDFHENYVAAIRTYNWSNSAMGKLLVRPDNWAKLERKYMKHVDKSLVTCREFKEVLLEKYAFLKADDIIVYMNVPNLEEFSSFETDQNIFLKNDSFILFYFGVIGERRGIFTCIEALKILVKQYPNIKLLLIGPIDKAIQTRFKTCLENPQIGKNIIHIPWIDVQYLPSYTNSSDVCLSPLLKNNHHDTTIANKIFQYMLFERPLIVSDCKPQQQIIEEENCGLVHKADRPEDLAKKVLMLYENTELRKKMGANGKKAVLEKYNLAVANKNVLKMYQELRDRQTS